MVALVLCVLGLERSCAQSGFGDASVVEFLPPDARAQALGGAFTALAEGATAAYWNPGALGLHRGRGIFELMPLSYQDLENW